MTCVKALLARVVLRLPSFLANPLERLTGWHAEWELDMSVAPYTFTPHWITGAEHRDRLVALNADEARR